MSSLSIGTRGSELALFQARAVAALVQRHAGISAEVVVIKTSGDRLAEAPLSQIGGKRLFVKEIEDALLAGDVDLAVHSSKDLPAVLPEGLEIGAVLPREDPRDALILPLNTADPSVTSAPRSLDEVARTLGPQPRVGTSSVRRSAQLGRLFTGARFLPIRGNLGTRLRKLDEGAFDTIVLAAAGLHRLQRADRIDALLPVDACVPAPGQGIIAVEVRAGDARMQALVTRMDDRPAAIALAAERAVVQRLGGGCQMPIGAYAVVDGGEVAITALVLTLDGAREVRASARGPADRPEAVGEAAARQLLSTGADDILTDVRRAQAAVEGLQP